MIKGIPEIMGNEIVPGVWSGMIGMVLNQVQSDLLRMLFLIRF